MKRVQYNRYGGPEEMSMDEYVPPAPGPDQVCIDIKAAAINPVDWKIRRGAMRIVTGKTFPKGMGADFSGVVTAVGNGVTNVRIGDEVFGTMDLKHSGAFGDIAVTESHLVVAKPSNLSFSEAACLPIPAATAWAAIIDKARARAGSRIFINGCSGAVGAFAVQLARACRARVSGTCGSSSIATVKAAGVERVFSYADATAFEADGKFDAVFDTLGTLGVSDGLAMLKPKGTFVDINPTLPRLMRGMLSGRYKLVFATMGYGRLPEIAELAAAGKLKPTIGQESPFADAISVITNVESGRRVAGRVVLVF